MVCCFFVVSEFILEYKGFIWILFFWLEKSGWNRVGVVGVEGLGVGKLSF